MTLFPRELSLTLCPDRAVLRRRTGRDEVLFEGAGPGLLPEHYSSRLAALAEKPAFLEAPLRVLVSDAWVRYDRVPVAAGPLSGEDALQLAHARFLKNYGAPHWPMRVAAFRDGLLTAGLEPELLAALEELAAERKLRLTGIEPLFCRLLDQAASGLAHFTGWLLADEEDLFVLAFLENGHPVEIRSQYRQGERNTAALALLERQAALSSRPERAVRCYALSGIPLRLPAPWEVDNKPLLAGL